jgi:hypothetical protein
LALTSPTSGGRSVGIVRLRTKATEFSLVFSLGRPKELKRDRKLNWVEISVIPTFAWSAWRKLGLALLGISGLRVGIWNRDLPNTKYGCYLRQCEVGVQGIESLDSHDMKVHQPNISHWGKILNSSTDWLVSSLTSKQRFLLLFERCWD